MRRFVLGTAGHVDHGKTTLVKALTGVDTDRLPEEKRRGITIELGFAPWDLGGLGAEGAPCGARPGAPNVEERVEVSVIDVPGHRRLVHTMIAGAIGMEVVLLVVAADEGVMPQTREHIAACEILGIRRAVVAVTKLDRVGEELARLAGEEARELLGSRLDAEVVVCSARTGEGLEDVRAAVRRALLSLPPRPAGARARLSVDRAFSVRGAGTVVTGTLVEGKIAVGAPLFLVGEAGAHATSARGLHVHDRAVQVAEAPTRLAVNLAGVPLEAVRRGDVVTGDDSVAATRLVDVLLRPTAEIRHGMSGSLYIGTARSTARIALLGSPAAGEAPPDRAEAPPPDQRGAAPREVLARLRLSRPIVVVGGDRFVLRGSDVEGPAGAVLGGGEVLDARPPRARPRARRRAALIALAEGSAPRAALALIDEAAPRPFPRAALGARFRVPAQDLLKAAERLVEKGDVARLKAAGWIQRAALIELASSARAQVAAHHERAPLDRGLPLETLRQRLSTASSSEAAEEAMRLAASKNASITGEPILIDGDVARLPSFTGRPAQGSAAGALGAASRAVVEAGLKGVTEHGVGELTSSPPREVKAILAKLVRDGVAIHAGDLWFSRAAVDELRAKVLAHLTAQGKLTVADFKAISGLGRKQTIILLEQLDREGLTRRQGDERVLARQS
ncbi:MAG: selenocysteine-specific translation elongation factor [Polyangiaceae bacterium]|nr:selenocysteine-specific translation elongation factor [Polyangiaceae bacterium]